MKRSINSSRDEYISPYCQVCTIKQTDAICSVSYNVGYGNSQEAGANIEIEDGGSF